jgi:hypothetical protein
MLLVGRAPHQIEQISFDQFDLIVEQSGRHRDRPYHITGISEATDLVSVSSIMATSRHVKQAGGDKV